MSHSMLKSLMPEEAGALLDACPLPVLLLDAAGCIRGCNRAFAALIRRGPPVYNFLLLLRPEVHAEPGFYITGKHARFRQV